MSRQVVCTLAAALLLVHAADAAAQRTVARNAPAADGGGAGLLLADAFDAAAWRAAARRAEAAGDGGGGFVEWLIKLSGPGFIGPRVSYFYETGGALRGERPWRIRLDLAIRWSVSGVTPDTASITMQTAQIGVETPIARLPLHAGVGLAGHQFTSDAFDSFSTFSVPITLGYRPRVCCLIGTVRVVPMVNGSLNLFPQFGPNDFLPLVVNVSRTGWELAPGLSLGADVRF